MRELTLATRLLLAAFMVVSLALALLTALAPGVDLAVSAGFWTREVGFWIYRHPTVDWLRELSMIPTIVLVGGGLLVLLLKAIFPSSRPILPIRMAAFFAFSGLLGPVLLVNVVLKEHWERGRPIHVAEFGGKGAFTPWWQPGDGETCTRNCSFMSGEASGAAVLLAPALLVGGPAQGMAVGAALAYTALIAGLRIAYGGHFLSDVALGALTTIAIVLLLRRWLYARPDAPAEAAAEARVAAFGDAAFAAVRGALAGISGLFAMIGTMIRRGR